MTSTTAVDELTGEDVHAVANDEWQGTGGDEPPSPDDYAKNPAALLRCKFVQAQVAFNAIASFVGPLATFYLLFGYASQGPYEWNSAPLVGVVVGSLAGSPLLIFALMPVGMPEAVERRWFLRLRSANCPPWLVRVLPYLNDNPRCWRWATARLLVLGFIIGVVYVPIALLIARYALGPTLSTWTLIWFNVVYEVCLAVPVTALGLLGYAMEPNLDWTISRMSTDPRTVRRLMSRCLASIQMIIWPSCDDEEAEEAQK
mmetsp:Transcript_32122/g.58073  ORF Transcript_32122/g.58073 Transcript_32122/m.58073 type:complete len:258 (+) Transcript_32122:32-805(+)|eukprot:CAMPEP_0201957888 /NCGR_PEP_ID=MMETSP0904-20121228/5186_1 /ASSEMBLY_ACC=CAM_ASM_000553 /TAXON_ID=420261 /ORGANISM="Thalassiosira antarctica, Strain CCMP982" /LENGTH=257 /DNA_ID=CAMNT_0048503081 /DNA_START=9 /DNA_END=782 /DNA_ORIENTATION=+